MTAHAQRESECEPKSPVYVLVIDHSGSMLQEMPGKDNSRWEYMRDLAADFVENAAPDTTIHLYVFEGYREGTPELDLLRKEFHLSTEAKRTEAVHFIRRGIDVEMPPNEKAGTALWDALGLAFEQAKKESSERPGVHIRVLAYSDGEDTHSQRWTPQSLQQEFEQVVSKNKEVYVFFYRFPGAPSSPIMGANVEQGDAPKPFVAVNVCPRSKGLLSPTEKAEQRFKLDIHFSLPREAKLVDGQFLTLGFESNDVEVEPLVRLPLKPGPSDEIVLSAKNANELSPDKEYSGRLKLSVPEIQGRIIQLTPPNGIEIKFQKAGNVEILDRGPSDNANFKVGEGIPFFAVTLDTATVTWDFGDGGKAIGRQTTHVYKRAGRFEATVNATAPGKQPAKPVTIPVNIYELSVNLPKPKEDIVAGGLCSLKCEGRGPIKRYEWEIQTPEVDGSPPQVDKEESETDVLDYKFDLPGMYRVQVNAISEYGPSVTDEQPVAVIPPPTLDLTGPVSNEPYSYMKPVAIVAKAGGGKIQAVDLSIQTEAGKDLLQGKAARIEVAKTDGVARYSCQFDEAETGNANVLIKATAVMVDDCDLTPPTAEIVLTPPVCTGRIVLNVPEGGFRLNETIVMSVESTSHKIKEVEWDFGNGQTATGETATTSYSQHKEGGYLVTATVKTAHQTKVWTLVPPLRREAPRASFTVKSKRKSGRVHVGDQVQIVNTSSGNVGKTVLLVDGIPFPPEETPGPGKETTWCPDSQGDKNVELQVWDTENLQGAGDPSHSSKQTVHVIRYRHVAFLAVLVLAIIAQLVLWRLFTRNRPRAWMVSVSQDSESFESLRKKVKDFWSRRKKTAEIPMNVMMKSLAKQIEDSHYWTLDEGKDKFLKIRQVDRGKNVRGVMDYSGEGDDAVTFGLVSQQMDKRVYELTDANAPDDEPLRHLYFQLHERDYSPMGDFAVIATSFVVLLGIVLWAANYAYFSIV